mgnify:CR=1 FL=1
MILKTFIKRLVPRVLEDDISLLSPKTVVLRKAISHSGFKFGLLLFISIILLGILGPYFLDISPYQQDLDNAVIGKFMIGKSQFELTRAEIDVIMDTLYRAKDSSEKKYKMGLLK